MSKTKRDEIAKKLKVLVEKPAVGKTLTNEELEKTSGGWSDYGGWGGGYDSYGSFGGGWMTCGDYNM